MSLKSKKLMSRAEVEADLTVAQNQTNPKEGGPALTVVIVIFLQTAVEAAEVEAAEAVEAEAGVGVEAGVRAEAEVQAKAEADGQVEVGLKSAQSQSNTIVRGPQIHTMVGGLKCQSNHMAGGHQCHSNLMAEGNDLTGPSAH